MIETPHLLHTCIRSSSFTINVFQHRLLWIQVIRMQPQPDIYLVSNHSSCSRRVSWILTWIMLYVMIGAPSPVHSHSRSTSYMHKVFQYRLLWVVVIRMQPQTEICLVFGFIKLPHMPTWHHSFSQHPTIEQHQRSAHPSKIGRQIRRLSPCMRVRLFAMVLSIESHSSNKLLGNNTQQSTYS